MAWTWVFDRAYNISGWIDEDNAKGWARRCISLASAFPSVDASIERGTLAYRTAMINAANQRRKDVMSALEHAVAALDTPMMWPEDNSSKINYASGFDKTLSSKPAARTRYAFLYRPSMLDLRADLESASQKAAKRAAKVAKWERRKALLITWFNAIPQLRGADPRRFVPSSNFNEHTRVYDVELRVPMTYNTNPFPAWSGVLPNTFDPAEPSIVYLFANETHVPVKAGCDSADQSNHLRTNSHGACSSYWNPVSNALSTAADTLAFRYAPVIADNILQSNIGTTLTGPDMWLIEDIDDTVQDILARDQPITAWCAMRAGTTLESPSAVRTMVRRWIDSENEARAQALGLSPQELRTYVQLSGVRAQIAKEALQSGTRGAFLTIASLVAGFGVPGVIAAGVIALLGIIVSLVIEPMDGQTSSFPQPVSRFISGGPTENDRPFEPLDAPPPPVASIATPELISHYDPVLGIWVAGPAPTGPQPPRGEPPPPPPDDPAVPADGRRKSAEEDAPSSSAGPLFMAALLVVVAGLMYKATTTTRPEKDQKK